MTFINSCAVSFRHSIKPCSSLCVSCRIMPKFIKRFKAPDYKDKHVFGVPLLVVLQRTGQPLPQCMLYAMRCLRRTARDAVGIFRKSGVRSRIQKLHSQVEVNPGQSSLLGFIQELINQLVYFRMVMVLSIEMNTVIMFQEILCGDNTILWISNLCPCVSVRWCFIELV